MNKKIIVIFLSILPICTFAVDNKDNGMPLPLLVNTNASLITFTAPLDTLQLNTTYQITCTISGTENSNGTIVLEPHLLSSSSYANVQLNNELIPNNSGTLRQGDNQLSFLLETRKDDPQKFNKIVLSGSADASIQVTQCLASKFLPKAETLQKNSTQNLGGAYYIVTNTTDKTVVINVGGIIFSSDYTISPHDWKTILYTGENTIIKQIK